MNQDSILAGYFSAFVIIACLYFTTTRYASAEDDNGHLEAVSLLSGYLNNLEAIRSYDVFIRNESTWISNGEDGTIEERVTFVRLVMDPDKNRCCGIQRRVINRITESPQGGVDQRSESLTAAILANGEGWFRHIPGLDTFKLRPEVEYVLMMTVDVPYVQLIGLSGFPMPYFRQIFTVAKECEMAFRSGAHQFTFDGTKHITVQYAHRTQKSSIDFNIDDLVPRSVAVSSILADQRVVPRWKERYRFKNREGLQIPTRITGERKDNREINGKSVFGTLDYNVDLIWLAVNEPLDEKYFNIKLLDDPKQLLTFVKEELLEVVE